MTLASTPSNDESEKLI